MMIRLAGGKHCLLRGIGILLVARFPFFVGNSVNVFARLRLVECHTLFTRRIFEPVREAVATEAGKVHQVDVLDIRMVA